MELFMSIFKISNRSLSKLQRGLTALLISVLSFSQICLPVEATHVEEAVTSSSLDANWPSGPSVSSEAAILIEAETGTILYEKNIHQQMYPASITKTLTTLIAYERCDLNENVVFTQEALNTIPADSSRIWVDRNNYMSVEDCLAAILIMSANDVAAGVAEHIAGSLDGFADIMNERAKELGCLNTHFVNSHGYHDPEHYTTAYDMAQIGRAFFDIDLLCTFAKERSFKHGPTEGQPKAIWEINTNKLLATREYEYEYLVGSKTGYTSQSGQTLISCAQKDGMKLICVVMNVQRPGQYEDTINLFNFGFSNFTTANISEHDQTYITADSSYGMDVVDVLGDSSPLLSMNEDALIVLPKTASFSDTTSYITMNTEDKDCMATAHYQYGTHDIGSTKIYVTASKEPNLESSGALEQLETPPATQPQETPTTETKNTNIKQGILYGILAVILIAIAIVLFYIIRIQQADKYSYRRKRHSNPLSFLAGIFIGFVQLLQAIWYLIKGIFGSKNSRNRNHTRDYNRNQKNNRNTSKEYYSQKQANNRKDIKFHNLKDTKQS